MARRFELVSGEGSEGNSYVNLSSTGEITLAKALDYEAFKNPVISIRVRCVDDETESIKNCERVIGFTVEEVFKINVLDELERPPIPPAPSQRDLWRGSQFGGPCKTPSLPMRLRYYSGFYDGGGNLRRDSSFQGKYGGAMCSHQVFVEKQWYDKGFPNIPTLKEYFAIVWDGQLWAPKTGTYKFQLETDDMSVLYINDKKIVDDNHGIHGMQATAIGKIHLKEGLHKFHLRYTQQPKWEVGCILYWWIPGGGRHVIPREYFYAAKKGQIKKLDSREPNWD